MRNDCAILIYLYVIMYVLVPVFLIVVYHALFLRRAKNRRNMIMVSESPSHAVILGSYVTLEAELRRRRGEDGVSGVGEGGRENGREEVCV